MTLNTIEEAVKALQQGQFIILADDEDRENEGDLIFAAELMTPEAMAFMIRHTTGIICLSMTAERLHELNLPQMVSENTDPRKTAFTISVDARHRGVTTGVSAYDRTQTILTLINPTTKTDDLCRPGHIFPLKCREGGVLKRAGHTEAAVDLMKLAGMYPAGVLSELMNDNGVMMRLPDLERFAKEHRLPFITVAQLIRYRRKKEKLVECISQARLPTTYGEFTAYVYESKLDGIQHVALVMGDVRQQQHVLVRVHSECLTGDIFKSTRCDCGEQLDLAMKLIRDEKQGVILYLRGHEGRGVGIGHKLRAYQLQDQGRDTVDANLELGLPIDSREYGVGAQILSDLGLSTIRLMTNNPSKYGGLEGYDLQITERVSLLTCVTSENLRYLQTKRDRMGHFLKLAEIQD